MKIIVEWKYDVEDGGSVEINPDDCFGMSQREISEYVYKKCKDDARAQMDSYVPMLYESVKAIAGVNSDGSGN